MKTVPADASVLDGSTGPEGRYHLVRTGPVCTGSGPVRTEMDRPGRSSRTGPVRTGCSAGPVRRPGPDWAGLVQTGPQPVPVPDRTGPDRLTLGGGGGVQG
jgi:hypothetical protein